MSGTTGRGDSDLAVPPVDDAILRGYLREHLAVAACLAAAAVVAAVVLVGSLGTLRRIEAHSMPVPVIVVEQLPAAPAPAVLASELPEPWLAGIATSLAVVASIAIAVRSTRWVRRLRRLVHQLPSEEVMCEATMTARMCESRAGVTLRLSEVDDCPPRTVVVFPLMASQQELVDRNRPLPVRVRWDARDPEVMVASLGGRVLWPRRRARSERRAAAGLNEGTWSAGCGRGQGSDGDQAGCMPARPASTTNDARVTIGAPGRET